MRPFDLQHDVLTENDTLSIDRIIEAHGNDPSDLVGILLDVEEMAERHYISKPMAYYVADKLELKPTQVYDVISFYTELHDEPRAKYPIQVCNSAPCRVCDSDKLFETLERLLGVGEGEVTYDGRFTIERVSCFGACDVSPAVRVNNEVYGNLNDEERILKMLRNLN